ncbi:PAAR domain-containing protein [Pseudomonas japonica]|uniref:PAAR domain-containing protein n=1 Tax=Pseudomonas japonica TaxID=256466 RepID=UPI00380B970B
MAQKGFFLRQGDKTSCGGLITGSDTQILMYGIAHARQGDAVTCGVTGKSYTIQGGVWWITSNGVPVAGTLDSVSGCPCRARLYHTHTHSTYVGRAPEPSAPPARSSFVPSSRSAAPSAPSPASTPQSVTPPGSPEAITRSCGGAIQLINQHGTACATHDYLLLHHGKPVGQSRLNDEGYSHICESTEPVRLQVATSAPSPVLE